MPPLGLCGTSSGCSDRAPITGIQLGVGGRLQLSPSRSFSSRAVNVPAETAFCKLSGCHFSFYISHPEVAMVRKIKLRQPDRSGPSEKTLLQIAEERGLFAQAEQKEKEKKKDDAGQKRALPKSAVRVRVRQEEDDDQDDDALSPTAERVLETMLWTVSLAMLHFTLDVLVQHQFSIDRVQWPQVCIRAVQALMGELLFLPLLLPSSSSSFPPPPHPPSARDSHAVVPNGTLLLTVAASVASLRPTLLPVAPACVQSANPTRPSPALPARLPPGRLLRHEPRCRLPPHPRYQ